MKKTKKKEYNPMDAKLSADLVSMLFARMTEENRVEVMKFAIGKAFLEEYLKK